MGRQQTFYALNRGSVYDPVCDNPEIDDGSSSNLLGEEEIIVPSFPAGHRKFVVFCKKTLERAWVAVPDKRSSTVLNLKEELAKEFKIPTKSQELTYGGMPLVNSWHIPDLPPDAEALTLWVRKTLTKRLEEKARPTLDDKQEDFELHPSQITDFEDENEAAARLDAHQQSRVSKFEQSICDAHNRRIEIMNMNWELEKSKTTLEYAEERKQIVQQGSVLADYLSKENARLLKEAENAANSQAVSRPTQTWERAL